MKFHTKHKYLLYAIIPIAIIVLAVSLSGSGKSAKSPTVWIKLDPVPLNKLLFNSMSDIPQPKKLDAAILRFMRYWDIKGGSFALMRNDSLIYAHII